MPNPTPIYTVTYDGVQLPGYVQSEDRPVVMSSIDDEIMGREGINTVSKGSIKRGIGISFLVKSSLGTGVTDLQHLNDCKNQWRTALAILTRRPGMKTLYIQDSDRYYLAKTDRVSMPLAAGQSRSIIYTVDWSAQPWAYAAAPVDTTFTGNTTLNITIGDSRKTYPQFLVPAAVTAFTATDENGKVLSFLRGTQGGDLTIDCANFRVTRDSDGSNAIGTMTGVNYGLNYNGTSGSYQIVITGFAGSGTVTVRIRNRWEL